MVCFSFVLRSSTCEKGMPNSVEINFLNRRRPTRATLSIWVITTNEHTPPPIGLLKTSLLSSAHQKQNKNSKPILACSTGSTRFKQSAPLLFRRWPITKVLQPNVHDHRNHQQVKQRPLLKNVATMSPNLGSNCWGQLPPIVFFARLISMLVRVTTLFYSFLLLFYLTSYSF